MLRSYFKIQAIMFLLVLLLTPVLTSPARAVEPEPLVALGAGFSYAVFAGTEITNTGTATRINGDIGTASATSITGLTSDQSVAGMTPANDDNAELVQYDLMMAYHTIKDRNNAKVITSNLGGQTLTPGIYSFDTPATVSGTLKLDAQGDINAVFIFQVNATLITEQSSQIELINEAQFSRIFWQVSNDVRLAEKTNFKGTILANKSVFVETDVIVQGRLLAITGGVTLNNTQVDMMEIAAQPDSDKIDIRKTSALSEIVRETLTLTEPDVATSQENTLPESDSAEPAIAVPNTELTNTSPDPAVTTMNEPITLDGTGDSYKVTIDWGSMTFNYDLGTWNPSSHSWIGGGWNAAGFNASNNQIRIMNESTQPVTASFTYLDDLTDGGSTTGTFEDADGLQTGIMELPSYPVGGPVPTTSTYLKLQGQPPKIGFAPTKIGTIGIQLSSVLP